LTVLCGDVDAVAENVIALDQHVAKIDADAPPQSAIARTARLFGKYRLIK
jgi:hypothetical protein